jgi:copper chaperone
MIELTLPDMTCGHCVKTVTRTVQQVDAAGPGPHRPAGAPRADRRPRSRPSASRQALAEEGYPKA